jgi:hypothetical protein
VIYALKLLLEVLVAAGACAFVMRKAFAGLLTEGEYRRAWVTLLVGTAIAFLARSPALFLVGVGITGLAAASSIGRGVPGRLAVFTLLSLCLPSISLSLDGFAGVNRLLVLNDIKLLAILLLAVPAMRLLGRRRTEKRNRFLLVDLAVFGYQIMRIALQFGSMSGTGLARLFVEAVIDTLLPYYVLTRGIDNARDLRFVMSHFLLACVFAGAVALMEFVLRHNIYTELEYVYGIRWQLTHTLFRNGLARVQAMTPVPIILAFVMSYTIGLWIWMKGGQWRSKEFLVGFVALWIALIVTWSRGPLLGALVLMFSLFILRSVSGVAFRRLLIVGVVLGVVAKMMGADQFILQVLAKVFGSSEVDFGSIDYRHQLLDTSLSLIRQSPWFGVRDYQAQMQDLQQGEHIIDIVNTYIAVTLDAGLVGLFLYLFPTLYVLNKLLLTISTPGREKRSFGGLFAPAYVALIVSCLVTIFTTSTFGEMPLMMIYLVGVPLIWLGFSAPEQALCDVAAGAPAARPVHLGFVAR